MFGFISSKNLLRSVLFAIILLTVLAPAVFASGDYRSDDPKKPVFPEKILPKHVRWGCLVCHSDKKLSKITGNKEKSLFIDENILGNSMHKNIACLDCHANFSYGTHPPRVPDDYKKVAGLACKKCHPYQYDKYSESKHAELVLSNSKKNAAKCSDCHGSHDIQRVSFKAANKSFRKSAKWMCAKCHEERAQSYNDYYHGAAFKRDAADAPSCWDCHDNHSILKADNPQSTVNEQNLPDTCNKCHTDAGELFVSYAKAIHGRNQLLEKNFIAAIFYKIFPSFKAKQKVSYIGKEIKSDTVEKATESSEETGGLIKSVINFFFPESLRPRKELSE